jgi:hypothetical protein
MMRFEYGPVEIELISVHIHKPFAIAVYTPEAIRTCSMRR